MIRRVEWLAFAAVALIAALLLARWAVGAPAFTDAYYHLNAATRLVSGQGLTDAYVWTYIGALETLPMPSHLYWMPMTSLWAALGMTALAMPGDHGAAQLPFAIGYAGMALIAFAIGWRLSGTRRGAWLAGLLAIFSGFFVRFWGTIDTFAPYGLIGSAALLAIGWAFEQPDRRWRWVASGALSGLGHLTRADGLLLLIVALIAVIAARAPLHVRLRGGALILMAYAIVMSPYAIRNLTTIGAPLPLGGTQAIWFRDYNDLFNYPPASTPETLFADGAATFIASRREALVNNLGTFVAVEGMIVLTPLMLIGWWRRRRMALLAPFALYALGLHAAMTFVFPFPGYRGGLFHSAAALVPFWMALGVVGLDDVLTWVARRRRWRLAGAQRVFSTALILYAVALSLWLASAGRVAPRTMTPAFYSAIDATLPVDARVLYDDMPELYHFIGRGGATLPNGTPDTLHAVARQYAIDYLVLKTDRAAVPVGLWAIYDDPPAFLTLEAAVEGALIYAITR